MVLRSLAALAVPFLLLVSCSGDDPEPILSPSDSLTPTNSEPASTPTEISETSEEFVERWVDLNNEMQTSGDTNEYRAASPKCQPCQSFADQIDDIYSAGGFVRTNGWQILEIGPADGPKERPRHDVEIKSRPTSYAESKGCPCV